MENRLEDFVRRNRDAFDDREPAERVWRKIERSLFHSRSFWNSVSLWRAAAIVFMCLSIYLLVPKDNIANQNNTTVSNEFSDVEAFYVKQITEKVRLIDGFEDSDGNFTQDLYQLEAMYLVLKDEMKARPSQKVRDAIVLNLLVQIDLLNQQLHKLETQSEQNQKDEDPKASI